MPATIKAELRIVNAAASPGVGVSPQGGSGFPEDVRSGFRELARFLRRPSTIFGGAGGLTGGLGGLTSLNGRLMTAAGVVAVFSAVLTKAITTISDKLAERFGAEDTVDVPLDVKPTPTEYFYQINQPVTGGVLDITPTGPKGVEATPELVWDPERGGWRLKNQEDFFSGLGQQFNKDYPFLSYSVFGFGTGDKKRISDFDLRPEVIKAGTVRVYERLRDIAEDMVINEEEQEALIKSRKEVLDLLVDLDEKKLSLESQGKELTKSDLDARKGVIDVLSIIDEMLLGEIDKKKLQIELQEQENKSLKEKLRIIREINDESGESRSRTRSKMFRTGIIGEEGEYRGRVVSLPGVGDKFVGIKVPGS